MKRRRFIEDRTPVYEPEGGAPAEPEETSEEQPPEADLLMLADQGTLSDHLASVLRAAEVAAKAMREEAEMEAELILEEAEQQATALREANRNAAELIAEAERARTDAEDEGNATRQLADAYADETRREAEASAAQIIAAAERAALERARELENRQRASQESIDQTSERLRHLVQGLRDLAVDLEDLATPDEPADVPAAAHSTNPVRESLVESLKASIAQESLEARRSLSEEK
ncbi:MAG: hypothetical protein QOH23_1922 [Gaiellaceae bacterium]|nr:hypothetical protein [Gaiellaceae bacterium]